MPLEENPPTSSEVSLTNTPWSHLWSLILICNVIDPTPPAPKAAPVANSPVKKTPPPAAEVAGKFSTCKYCLKCLLTIYCLVCS